LTRAEPKSTTSYGQYALSRLRLILKFCGTSTSASNAAFADRVVVADLLD
jgi:hypothetical protein